MGAGLANDGLVAFRRAGGGEGLFLAPDLAVSLPTPTANGRTYTFQLRRGIHYSNGRLVRPADFRRAIERTLALGGREQPGSYYDGIVGAAACVKTPKRCDLSRGITTATGTVTFHLTGADPAFLYKLALPNAVAEPSDTPLKAPLPLPATGPYMYRTFDKKRQIIELVRNLQFRPWSAAARPEGFPDRIRIHFGYGADAAVRAVERGKADLASVRFDNSAAVRAELRIRYRGLVHSYPVLNVQGALLNTQIPPFDDRRARQAFNDAVDRRRLVALAGADKVTPTCQFLPPNLAGYRRYCPYMRGNNVDGPYTGPDLAKARRLVAASHTRGERVVFRDPSQHGPTVITRYLLSVLRGLGYRVRLARGEPKPRDQITGGGWGIDYPDTSAMLLPIVGCGSASNTFSFCEARIDRDMARAVALEINRPQAAARLWANVDRDVTDEAPWVPYLNERSVDVVSARTGNYVFTAQGAAGPLYDQLWVR
jgi:ABC-type transport system substrate-binding protein